MAKSKTLMIDEVHLSLRIPADLPDDEVEAVRQTLAGDDFMSRLLRAVRAVIRDSEELNRVQVSLTR